MRIGDIVIYRTTEAERMGMFGKNNVQHYLPAIVTAVWSNTLVNAKVFLDGTNSDKWKTSIEFGYGEGQWQLRGEDFDPLITH